MNVYGTVFVGDEQIGVVNAGFQIEPINRSLACPTCDGAGTALARCRDCGGRYLVSPEEHAEIRKEARLQQ